MTGLTKGRKLKGKKGKKKKKKKKVDTKRVSARKNDEDEKQVSPAAHKNPQLSVTRKREKKVSQKVTCQKSSCLACVMIPG